MSLPNEYIMEDAVRSIDDVIVYRADHPIHGTVNVYLPDESLPPELAVDVKRRLYKSGRQMRNISLLNIPYITRSLEVSQNPNEPYIVTKHAEHDLEELISNGVTLPPKRIFTILSQVLQATVNLASNDWILNFLYPRQIKMSDWHTSDISLTLIEGTEQQIIVTKTVAAKGNDEPSDTIETEDGNKKNSDGSQKVATQLSNETRATEDKIDLTSTFEESGSIKQSRVQTRNIYLLGNVTYQLLFGRKYQSDSKTAETDLNSLSRRWMKILEKALSRDANHRYETYNTMLRDVKKALNRNKRLAVASIPLWLILVFIGAYWGYERYNQHKIMTSEAGQAIKKFLDIVNKTEDKLPELKRSESTTARPDEEAILKPFKKIEKIEEN